MVKKGSEIVFVVGEARTRTIMVTWCDMEPAVA